VSGCPQLSQQLNKLTTWHYEREIVTDEIENLTYFMRNAKLKRYAGKIGWSFRLSFPYKSETSGLLSDFFRQELPVSAVATISSRPRMVCGSTYATSRLWAPKRVRS
jgi:hypothetical protein